MTEQDRIEYFKNEISRLSNQVVDLLNERDQLQAQVELLRVAATVVLNARDEDGITTSGLLAKFDELSKALSFLPPQCLAEIKAMTIMDAIDTHKNKLLTFDFDTAIRVTDLIKYANQLRQAAKVGE